MLLVKHTAQSQYKLLGMNKTLSWCSLTLNTACSSGIHNLKWCLGPWKCAEVGNKADKRAGGYFLWGEAEDTWVYPAWREGDQEVTSLCSAMSSGGEAKRDAMLCSLGNTGRIHRNGTKLHKGSFRLSIRNIYVYIFCMCVQTLGSP